MELEDYLIETEPHILAINRISKLLANDLLSNTTIILKGQIDKNKLKEMYSLCLAIQMITYCMRIKRKHTYKEIDKNFQDKFSLDSMMNEDFAC